jgi:Cu-processing system permease protein
MFNRVSTVALNAYREAVRARILLGLAGIAFTVALYSLVVGAYTLGEAPRVVADLGAAGISLFSIVVAIAICATTLHRELEHRTIIPILARPLRRSEYLVGKYLGTMLVVGVFNMANSGLVLMMSAGLAGRSVPLVLTVGFGLIIALVVGSIRSPRVATFGPIAWSAAMVIGGYLLCGNAPGERSLVMASAILSFFEVGIIAAFAMFFSSFSTPFLATFYTVCIILVGRSADSLTRFPRKFFGEAIHDIAKGLAHVFPNLHVYVPARPLLTGESLDANLPSYIAMAGLQAVAWAVGVLAISAIVFRRRDFL